MALTHRVPAAVSGFPDACTAPGTRHHPSPPLPHTHRHTTTTRAPAHLPLSPPPHPTPPLTLPRQNDVHYGMWGGVGGEKGVEWGGGVIRWALQLRPREIVFVVHHVGRFVWTLLKLIHAGVFTGVGL